MINDMVTRRALVENSPDADLLRGVIGFACQRLMELEVAARTRTPYCENWVSLSPKYVGVGGDDRVIWGGRDSNRLLGEAMKEQSPSL